MEYLTYQERAKWFLDKTDNSIANELWPIKRYELHHPLVVDPETLQDILPPSANLSDILERTRGYQKELANTIDINQLPADRPPGYIGQLALFKAITQDEHDLSYILKRTIYEWDLSGFTLFYYILRSKLLSELVGAYDLDVLTPFVLPSRGVTGQSRYEQLWVDRMVRAYSSIYNELPLLQHDKMRCVLARSSQLQDRRGVSQARIQKWCKCSRREAKDITKILRLIEYGFMFRIVAPNLKLCWSIQKDSLKSNLSTTYFARCRNLSANDGEAILISENLIPLEGVEDIYYSEEYMTVNLDLYDSLQKTWRIGYQECGAVQKKDLVTTTTIASTSVPNNHKLVTKRDVFFTALLRLSNLNNNYIHQIAPSVVSFYSEVLGIKNTEVKNAIDAVFRKNLLMPHYTFPIRHQRVYLLLAESYSNNLYPYAESLMRITPRNILRISNDGRSLCFWFLFPNYLENDFLMKEKKLCDVFDVEREVFRVEQSWNYRVRALMSQIDRFK